MSVFFFNGLAEGVGIFTGFTLCMLLSILLINYLMERDKK